MPWSKDTANIPASDLIAHLVIPYTIGKGLDVGCGSRKCWPRMIGIDNNSQFGHSAADIVGDACDLGLFADSHFDFVFSSFLLQYLDDADRALREWARILKKDGFLVLYVPNANAAPEMADDVIRWKIKPGDIAAKLKEVTDCGWTQIECEDRSARDGEYGLFEVYRKRDDGQFIENVWKRNPEGKKRCLVIRYGAIGDQIIASSILPHLKAQGYFVSYYTTDSAREVLKLDPHVDEFIIAETDQVPNPSLGAYWDSLRAEGRYDLVINLSESLEGAFLTLAGRIPHTFTHEARHKLFNGNYSEYIHDIAGVPHKINQTFYMSEAERAWAEEKVKEFDGPVVAWAITGSSYHKTYPFLQVVIAWLVQQTPAHVVLMGDGGVGKALQDGVMDCLKQDGIDTSRIHPMAGEWTVRESLSFVQFVDCMVGPETGLLNAVASKEDVAKIIYLSHSSKNNLTKHWVNTVTIEPDTTKVPCYPCHRLHLTWEHCHKVEQTGAALCASSIEPERIFKAVAKALIRKENLKLKRAG